MVTVVCPTAPVASATFTVSVRPGGAATVSTPAEVIVSPVVFPASDQVSGCLAPSERTAWKVTDLPGLMTGFAGVMV
jgi:hypothetical protein